MSDLGRSSKWFDLAALDQRGRHQRLIVLWLLGIIALVSIAAAVSAIGFGLPIGICALLLIILLFSLFASIVSSALFSIAAVGCLDFFFVAPLHSYAIDAPQDVVVLVTFLATSLVISSLTRRIRFLDKAQSAQAQQIDLAKYLAEAQKLSRTGSFGWHLPSQHLVFSEETFRIFDVENTVTPSPALVLQRTHPDDLQLVRDAFERSAQTGGDIDLEHRLLLPDGTIKHLRVVAPAISNGESLYVGAVMDISEQKRTFTELQKSEQRYKQLFNLVPVALWELDASALRDIFIDLRKSGVTDLQQHFVENPNLLAKCMEALIYKEANERAVRLFGGRDASDFVGHSVGRGWKERPETFQRAMVNRFNGESTFEEETKMTTLDGRVVDVLFTTARLGQAENTTTSVIGAMDITERVRAQEQIQRLQADIAHAARVSMLGELTASIAHEVNQPLGAIATTGAATLRWLDHPKPNIDGVRLRIGRMVEDARRAAEIISRIRAMATKATPDREHISIDDVIREALLFLRQEIMSRGAILTHYPASAAPLIFGDRTQLQQLVVNLCINAIQAAQHPSRINIRTSVPDENTICCIIEDGGPGIPPEHLDKVFESFFTTKEGSTGIGLAICRSIATSHAGAVTVDNDSALGGARFTVTLPAAARSPNT